MRKTIETAIAWALAVGGALLALWAVVQPDQHAYWTAPGLIAAFIGIGLLMEP
jgi:hypothetical protein